MLAHDETLNELIDVLKEVLPDEFTVKKSYNDYRHETTEALEGGVCMLLSSRFSEPHIDTMFRPKKAGKWHLKLLIQQQLAEFEADGTRIPSETAQTREFEFIGYLENFIKIANSQYHDLAVSNIQQSTQLEFPMCWIAVDLERRAV